MPKIKLFWSKVDYSRDDSLTTILANEGEWTEVTEREHYEELKRKYGDS